MSELPKGWVEATIGTLADYVSRGRSPKYIDQSELPVINQRCVRWNGVDENFVKFVDPATWHQWDDDRFLRHDDILWNSTGTGTIGRAALFATLHSYDRAVVDSHVTIVRSGPCVLPTYLFGYIRSPAVQDKIEDMQSGSTNQVELNRSEILSTTVPLAPLAEQQRIVAKVDGLTARTARAHKELDRIPTLIARYKQRLLALAFSGELTASWRLERRLRSAVPTSLDDLTDGLRYGTAQKCYSEPKGVAVLRIPNVSSGLISLDDLKYAELDSKEFAKLELLDGDILVVRSNGSADLVGRPALVSGAAIGLAFAGYLIRIRPRADLVSPRFLAFMLESPETRRVIEHGARSTSGVHNVNAKELGALQIPLFDLHEQVQIVRRIESAFAWLDRLAADQTAASRLISKLDAAILSKAFCGELVSQDPTDEPADALLRRVSESAQKSSRPPRRPITTQAKETFAMTRRLEEVLAETADWIPAQEAFRRCGVADGAQTEEIEAIYSELRALDRAGRVIVEPVMDAQGRKLFDRLKRAGA